MSPVARLIFCYKIKLSAIDTILRFDNFNKPILENNEGKKIRDELPLCNNGWEKKITALIIFI
jgi:hypothetical protein